MPYKYLEKIATADIAFEAEAKTIEELFTDSALAVMETMVELKDVEQKEKRIVELEGNNIENLLFDWLSEIVFIKDSENMLFSGFNVEIKDNKLKAECLGEKIDQQKHRPRVDVKAITLHKFRVERVKDKWKASIIIDI